MIEFGSRLKPDGLVHIFDWVREAPFWNVLALYGHYPNSFCPPPLCQTRGREKKCPKPSWQALYTPGQTWGIKCTKHLGKPLQPPPFRAMPIWKQHISKGSFPKPSNEKWKIHLRRETKCVPICAHLKSPGGIFSEIDDPRSRITTFCYAQVCKS